MNTVVVSSYEISCYCIPTIMWLSGYIPLLCQLKDILLIGNIVSMPLNPKPYLVLQLLSNSPFTLAWNRYEPVDRIVRERGSASIYTSHHNIYIYIASRTYRTRTHVLQCSHASVRLTQARPNYLKAEKAAHSYKYSHILVQYPPIAFSAIKLVR